MQNFGSGTPNNVLPQSSSGHYTVIVADATDSSDPDEFVLDLSTLPCELDYVFGTSTSSTEKSLQYSFYDHGTCADLVQNGTKRKFETEDVSQVNRNDETRSSGYESDTEADEDNMLLERKKKKIRHSDYKAARSPSNEWYRGAKRSLENEDEQHRKKRLKTSLPCEYKDLRSSDSSSCSESNSSSSDSSSSSCSSSCSCTDSSTSSDTSSSDIDTPNRDTPYKYLGQVRRILPCPKSCVCKVGQSRPPIPIERSSRSVQPLYKKLLQRRLLSTANIFSNTCCHKKCCQNWARKRISLYGMVKDYSKSDLRVDFFSWGQWKQAEEDEGSSSDEDWFW